MIRLRNVYLPETHPMIPNKEAVEFLYELMKERDPEINISHSTLPTFEEHKQFVWSMPYRFWYLIESDVYMSSHNSWTSVGSINATNRNEIGIVLWKAYRGLGFGPQAIRAFLERHQPLPVEKSVRSGHWLANIAPTNSHSQHMFIALGFRKIQETYAYQEESNGDKNTQTPD